MKIKPKTILDFYVEVDQGLTSDAFYYPKKPGGSPVLLAPDECIEVLVTRTGLRYLRMYPLERTIYLYLPKTKCYSNISPYHLEIIISKIFRGIGVRRISSAYLTNVVEAAFREPLVSFDTNSFEDMPLHLAAVPSGLLALRENKLLPESGPDYFVTTSIPYDSDRHCRTPYFDRYMALLSDGNPDKRRFLMAVFAVILKSPPDMQYFFHLYGSAGSGKSVFTKIARALVGEASTHATTLKALNQDPFEPINLSNKKLVIIGDAENYTRDTNILKGLTGGDALRGRLMHTNMTRAVDFRGTLIMTSNARLNVRDSGGVQRRIRAYKTTGVPSEPLPFLYRTEQNKWDGLLVPELPGILYQVLSTPHEDIVRYIKEYNSVPALQEGREETADALNPLRRFVQAALVPGEGAFIGYRAADRKETREYGQRGTLFPAYLTFQFKHNLPQNVNHSTFTALLMAACEELGIPVVKERKEYGVYVKGVCLHPSFYTPDNI